jgi:hypothetical protein
VEKCRKEGVKHEISIFQKAPGFKLAWDIVMSVGGLSKYYLRRNSTDLGFDLSRKAQLKGKGSNVSSRQASELRVGMCPGTIDHFYLWNYVVVNLLFTYSLVSNNAPVGSVHWFGNEVQFMLAYITKASTRATVCISFAVVVDPLGSSLTVIEEK